jgi:putative transposase
VICRILGVSPSGFYAWRVRPESSRSREDRRLKVQVTEAHERSRRTYGSPRIHAELRANGAAVSRKRVIRLMREDGLRGRGRRRFKSTTDSKHNLPIAPNILARDFTANAPNERWVGDVTELRTPQGKLFLAAILDLFSRAIVGWATSAINDRRLAENALQHAARRRAPPPGLLHHTDRGSPYASEDYQKALATLGFQCSMSRRGNCYDNAPMESFFNTLKLELAEDFDSPAAARRELFDYIETFYNAHRRHSALGFLSPREFERRARTSPEDIPPKSIEIRSLPVSPLDPPRISGLASNQPVTVPTRSDDDC